MGIFKNITRTLKQAAPVIGSAIGMYFGGPVGAAVGSGIGSLAAGRSTEEALRNAAQTGATTYAIGGKDFGKGFNFSTSGSPFAGREVVGQSRVPSFMGGRVVDSVPVGKSGSFFTSPTGIATLGLGAAALGGLGEEEKKAETTMQPYPEGRSRLGMGRIGNKFYDLNDEDERRQYFEDLRNRNKDKDKDDDEVVTMRSGGLNMLGQTINRGLQNEIKGRTDQIGPFLDQVGDMAQEKFGVDVTTDSGFGGTPFSNISIPGPGLGFPSQLPGLMGGRQDTLNDIRAAYMPIDQGDGIDQFGKPMETTGSTTVPKDPAKALELFSNAFNRGVSSGSGPFGAGASRLGGIGAMRNLFMNNGGEVEGPGTGTSDSVPARLSDGEFVLTAKAVRGAGGGDRDIGAARMYDMMSELERVA